MKEHSKVRFYAMKHLIVKKRSLCSAWLKMNKKIEDIEAEIRASTEQNKFRRNLCFSGKACMK